MDIAGIDLIQTGFSLVISLVGYVLLAFGLYTVAKRRGVRNPWLAWIPFGQSWMLGCISDQYRQVALCETKNRRKVLLGTRISMMVISILVLVLCFVILFSVLSIGFQNLENMTEDMTILKATARKSFLFLSLYRVLMTKYIRNISRCR